MIAYASGTGTVRNLDALRRAGWRLLLTADTYRPGRIEGFRFALDNGAWGAHASGVAPDWGRFAALVDELGERADWAVLPDIVGGGLASLDLSLSWVDRVRSPQMLAVQDGIKPAHVETIVGPSLGIFVGGTTQWKLDGLLGWGELARARSAPMHVARVNTLRRIRRAALAGATSFDGTSVTRFASNIHKLDAGRRNGVLDLFGGSR